MGYLTLPGFVAMAIASYWLSLGFVEKPLQAILISQVITVTLIIIAERLLPADPDWNESKGDVLLDIGHTGLTVVGSITFIAFVFIAADQLGDLLSLKIWPKEWPVVIQVLLAIVVFEFVDYWIHRAQHKIPFLWRFHTVHHSSERLYWLNTFKFHLFDIFLKVGFGYGTLFLLGIEVEVFAAFGLMVFVLSFLQHVNVKIHGGYLNWIIATAELHRWHHSKANEYCNYGQVTILWDIVFGTRYLPEQQDIEIGLASPTGFPKKFFQQLVAPFSSRLFQTN